MAKDPAYLFYPGDFHNRTMLMTDEEVGKYMRVLNLLFHSGHTSKADIERVVGPLPNRVLEKLDADADGLLYNDRLEEEQNKRKRYTESRRKNVKGNNQHKSGHMTKHMTTHMENENENRNSIDTNKKIIKASSKKMKRPTLEEVAIYMHNHSGQITDICNQDAAEFINHYQTVGWVVGKAKTPMKDWKAASRNWLIRKSKYNGEKSKEDTIGRYTRSEFENITDYSGIVIQQPGEADPGSTY